MKKAISLLYLFFIFCFPFWVSAEIPPIRFETFDINDGLSQNMVNTIVQDSQGFMWFGTMDGLNRFDGYNMKAFYHDPSDSKSIMDNVITAILSDGEKLWIGAGGLNMYDASRNIFYRFALDSHMTDAKKQIKITALIKDNAGYLWVGTEKSGLYRLKITGSVENKIGRAKAYASHHDTYTIVENEHYLHDINNQYSIPSGSISDLLVDNSNKLWVSGSNGLSFIKLDKPFYDSPANTVNFTHIENKNTEEKSFEISGVKSLYEDHEHLIWAGNDKGLIKIKYNNIDQHELLFFPHQKGIYELDWEGEISDIKEINNGYLWLATKDALAIFNKSDKTYQYIKKNPTRQNGLIHSNILSIFKDLGGIVWLGTGGKGINKYNPKVKPFRNYLHQEGKSVYAISKDKNENIWAATSDFDLLKIDTKHGIQKEIHISSKMQRIYDIIEGPEGSIWMVSAGNLYKYNPNNEKMQIYTPKPPMAIDPDDENIYFLELERDHTIWAIHHKMVLAFDVNSSTFKYYPLPDFDHNGIQCYAYLGNGKFWIGTKAGLLFIDVNNNQWKFHNLDNGDNRLLKQPDILSILPDPDSNQNVLWIGTSGNGFYRLEVDSGKLLNYNTKKGLPNNVVYGMLPDDRGNLWLSTNQGLSCFNMQSQTFRNYKAIDGIQSNEFNRNSYYKALSGELLFGGINGITEFQPSEITVDTYIPPIVITDIIINQSFKAKEQKQQFIPFLKSDGTYELKLDHNHNNISIEFAALSYALPHLNQYAFKLEPLDNVWNNLGNEHRVNFIQLSPGNYILKLKGANNDGTWNDIGIQLLIQISPPFTGTVVAYILYGLIIMAIIYFVFKYYLNHVRLQEQVKFKNLETEKLKELNLLKSRFFTNISHEFRTPLTLIKAPLHDLILKPELSEYKKTLTRISNNASRVFNLINQLLDVSRLESNKIVLKPIKGDILQFISMMADTLKSLSYGKEVSIEVVTEERVIMANFDPDIVQKILTNLISNAVKFVDSNGEIKIDVRITKPGFDSPSLKSTDEWLQISVIDDGSGIAADELPRIFDRYYQTSKPNKSNREGFGIGLSLVKELVEIHQGKISVSSIAGVGTTFVVLLPILSNIAQDIFDELVVKDFDDSTIENYYKEPDFSIKDELLNGLDHLLSEIKSIDPLILIVEDHKDLSDYIAEVLKPWCQTIQAKDGEEGIQLALEKIPDLIITDIVMPKMDGLQLTRSIKNDERTNHIPIIILTAKAEDSDKVSGLITGADDYLLKPFNTEELLIRIKNLILIRKNLQKKLRNSISYISHHEKSVSIKDIFIEKVINVIEQNIDNENFGVEMLAEEVSLSPSQLYRKLIALTNISTVQIIQNYRLDKAMQLIKQEAGNISEIAHKTGFKSPAYFTKCFKSKFGKIPTEYMT